MLLGSSIVGTAIVMKEDCGEECARGFRGDDAIMVMRNISVVIV